MCLFSICVCVLIFVCLFFVYVFFVCVYVFRFVGVYVLWFSSVCWFFVYVYMICFLFVCVCSACLCPHAYFIISSGMSSKQGNKYEDYYYYY
jgi:hypothetical protein